jgi:hypothetical protein
MSQNTRDDRRPQMNRVDRLDIYLKVIRQIIWLIIDAISVARSSAGVGLVVEQERLSCFNLLVPEWL